MKSKLIKIAALALVSLIGLTSLIAHPAFADYNPCDSSLPEPVLEANGCKGTAEKGLPNTVVAILNAVIGVSGIVAVIYIIFGGFQYMTSAGDSGKAQKAKQTILYACIGLIVCVLAFAIVNFVIKLL